MAWMAWKDISEDTATVGVRGSIRGGARPGRGFRLADAPEAGSLCYRSVPDRGERVEREIARCQADDPGREPVHCWGPCGRTAVNGPNARRLGWKMRDIVCGPGMDVEVQCPECFSRWGFIEPLHSED